MHMETPPANKKPEPMGPLAAIFVIVLVFIVGGIYFLVMQQEQRQTPPASQDQAKAN